MASTIKSFTRPLLYIDDNSHERLFIQEASRATNLPFDFHGVSSLDEHSPAGFLEN